jgi:UDP-N-acetylglucosamine diphosphorylase/glucosamine-1-phosphate N-acetyltransferase
MVNIILFDLPQSRLALRPFTDTRPLAKIRVGITTLEEKWKVHLPGNYSYLTASYLQAKFPHTIQPLNYYINSAIFPTQELIAAIEKLELREGLVQGALLLAFVSDKPANNTDYNNNFKNTPLRSISFEGKITQLQNKWDIFSYNAQYLQADFQHIQSTHSSQSIQDPYTKVYNESAIYIAEGASIKAAILNAEAGPIYIGYQAVIEEGAIIKGPVAICEGAQVKAGGVIQNATTIGPYAKVGGEVTNSVIFGYSNKAHQGFLGNSVIGEWCNLGAGTNTSNLKNNYSTIQLWDYISEQMVNTPLQFCGLFMGDYSKCGINTMFNAGTVVGVSANLFGAGYHHKYIPSFTHGGIEDQHTMYKFEKAIESAQLMMQRRHRSFTQQEQFMLDYLAKDAITDWIKVRL